jgi:hypothetical protein
MPIGVTMGAMMKCSFGVAPSTLVVLPKNRVMSSNKPAANIMDNIAMMNIPPFGMCMSMSNPQVIAATSAAMGVLTPMPCMPVTVAPWTPGSPKSLVANMPALNNSCTLNCMWAGVITILNPGQFTCQI